MTMPQMVNHLNIKKIAGKIPARPGNEGDANQQTVQTLNVEVTIPLEYLS